MYSHNGKKSVFRGALDLERQGVERPALARYSKNEQSKWPPSISEPFHLNRARWREGGAVGAGPPPAASPGSSSISSRGGGRGHARCGQRCVCTVCNRKAWFEWRTERNEWKRGSCRKSDRWLSGKICNFLMFLPNVLSELANRQHNEMTFVCVRVVKRHVWNIYEEEVGYINSSSLLYLRAISCSFEQ